MSALTNNPTTQIRILGDPILHSPGIPFPTQPTQNELAELKRQLEIAKGILIKTGGAGIAANQCLSIDNPYQFTIVGVFYDNEEHMNLVNKRYPGVTFPNATIMINPRVNSVSNDTQHFKHGCLSVPGGLRGEIATPRTIDVTFDSIENNKIITTTRVFRDADAIVLQHELNHILHGKTYIDCCLSNLNATDLNILERAIIKEQNFRKANSHLARHPATSEFYHFIIMDQEEHTVIKLDELLLAFRTSVDDVLLEGLRKQITLLDLCNPR